MQIKNYVIIIFGILFLSSLVLAQTHTINIYTNPEDGPFQPGETIKIKIALYGEESNQINDEISITIKDIKENIKYEDTILSNGDFKDLKIPEDIISGEGEIILTYKETTINEPFFIGKKELAKFEITDGNLIVTNIGNAEYSQPIYITIGETMGTKTPTLKIGESISYRLVAPEGTYNIKITDEQTTITQGNVKLIGTGNVVGAIDNNARAAGITGGISPEDDAGIMEFAKRSKFVYVFIIGLFGMMILLTIEKRYKKSK